MFDRSYHSIRSIAAAGSSGGGNGHINGTQSLNRNLASRSAGALMITSNGCGSSTLSSNDSDQNYNLGNNQSSSAHHLSYNLPRKAQENSSNIISNENKLNEAVSMPFLNNTSGSAAVPSSSGNAPDLNNQNNKKSRLRSHLQDDTSTHGSRTIDSRYSNDKTLGLSDGDEDDNDEDDEEVEDYGEERVMGNGGGDADEEGCSSKLPRDVAVVCDCGQANCEGSVEGQRVRWQLRTRIRYTRGKKL